MSTATKQPIRPWEPEEDFDIPMDQNDYFDVFVSQSIGRIRLDPSGSEHAVVAAFKMIAEQAPGDNTAGHSSYEFDIPSVGHFNVEVAYRPPFQEKGK